MKTILAKDLKAGDTLVLSARKSRVLKDVFKSPINGRVYVTYDELHETGSRTFEEDFMFPFYTSTATIA